LYLYSSIPGINLTSWQENIHPAAYILVLKCMLTTGTLLGHGLAVPQSLETGQALRWLHGDFFHDSPERLSTTDFKNQVFEIVHRILIL
jgi:hypothetical protein